MKLWLLRHARAEIDAGICYGASDVPADEALTQMAAQAAAALMPAGAPIWVSGLCRAQQLARQLHHLRPDLPSPRTDTRLNEMDFGRWELQPWDAIPRAAFDVWMSDFAHHRFGGAESTQQLIHRVADAMDSLRASAHREAIWVTHAGVIRAAQFIAAQGRGPIDGVARWPKHAPVTGGHLCLDLCPDV